VRRWPTASPCGGPLGYKLARAEKLLAQFITYLEQVGAATVTTELALARATTTPSSTTPGAFSSRVARTRDTVTPTGTRPAQPRPSPPARHRPHHAAALQDRRLPCRTGKVPSRLALEDLNAETITSFLAHLEHDRTSSTRTRTPGCRAACSPKPAPIKHPGGERDPLVSAG